jgi:hypothetical protein
MVCCPASLSANAPTAPTPKIASGKNHLRMIHLSGIDGTLAPYVPIDASFTTKVADFPRNFK